MVVTSKLIAVLVLVSLLLPILFTPAHASSDNDEWQTHYAVNGFVNVGPPDPYQIFKIHYRVINGMMERFSMPYVEYAHYISTDVASNGNGVLEIRFPKNYPIYEGGEPTEAIFFLNKQEITAEHYDTDDCFIDFRIPLAQSGLVDVVWTTILSGEAFRGTDVPKRCLPDTVVQGVVTMKDGVISPLHQLKAGVKPDEVVCRYGFELITHPDGRPYCATPQSAEQLYNRWKMLPPPSPPAAQHPLLANVTSFISTPFTIVQNQRTPVEFRIQNDNDFALYGVKINNFSTAQIPVVLTNTYTIEELPAHETQVITGTLTTDPGYPQTGTSSLFWTILAEDRSGKVMESTIFQRQITVVSD